jgi:protein required for attachment to host cells
METKQDRLFSVDHNEMMKQATAGQFDDITIVSRPQLHPSIRPRSSVC